MTARAALAFLAAALLPIAAGCSRRPAAAPVRGWNLVLVTIDTLRADRLGAYGSSLGATPHLDALAAQGVRFAQATAHAPLTLPSHASILSGLLPTEHGLRQNGAGRLPDTVPTLATAASAAGYRTGAFVGAFVLARRFGLDRGFEVYDDEVSSNSASGAQRFDSERRADRVVDRALAWLGALPDPERPTFLWVHLFDPHAPYDPPAEWSGRFPGRPYEAEIAFADAEFGRLRQALPERTVIAVAADHGESLGEHGELTHGLLLYQPTLRVPVLLAAPGILPAGTEVAAPVGLVDLAPTLAGLLGMAFDGRDLSADLLARREPPPADLYAETEYPATFGWSGLAALRRGRWKAVSGTRTELFDLETDPAEASDRMAAERRMGRELAEAISTRRAATAAPVAGPSDAETRARLAALGYAAPPASPTPANPTRDPRDAVADFRQFEEAHWDLAAGRPVDAARRLQALVSADPGNAVFRAELGRARLRIGDHPQALALLNEAVALQPSDPQVWYNLGAACLEGGQLDEGERAFAEAARLDPAWSEPWNSRGLIALRRGDLGAAGERFERATELDPLSALAWNNLGNVRRETGRATEAEAAYRTALGLAPEAADPANGLGVLLVTGGRPAEAVAWFDRALAARPGNLEALLNRAVALELSGEPERAARDFRAYLEATSGDERRAGQRRMIEKRLQHLGTDRR